MSNPLRCVIDTSVCIKYFIADPLTAKVNQLLGHLANPQTEIYVPDLFYIKCTNVLLKYVRARMYTAAEVQTDLATLKSFPLRVVSTADLMVDAVSIP
ncbi:MAG: type II toxin-antitoxin system VapC family toxin [Nostoc sp. S4]|nr:type II toxin-antitoxin system VapC family toxin [Nostoc sp. S4]